MLLLNDDFQLRDQGVSNALNTGDLPRHRWYFVKEGFSPRLVERALQSEGVDEGEILLDPFSGGGTAPLTGAVMGMKARGFEVNPFLRFLSATKLLQTEPKSLERSSKAIAKSMGKPIVSALEGFSTFTKGNRWGRWLFPLDILRSFEGGMYGLSGVPQKHRNLLKLALLGAALDCCNAVRDGKCLRFQKGWQEDQASTADLIHRFEDRVQVITEDLDTSPLHNANAFVTEGDARKLVAKGRAEKFRLCVTSPPYLNSFDYSDV